MGAVSIRGRSPSCCRFHCTELQLSLIQCIHEPGRRGQLCFPETIPHYIKLIQVFFFFLPQDVYELILQLLYKGKETSENSSKPLPLSFKIFNYSNNFFFQVQGEAEFKIHFPPSNINNKLSTTSCSLLFKYYMKCLNCLDYWFSK